MHGSQTVYVATTQELSWQAEADKHIIIHIHIPLSGPAHHVFNSTDECTWTAEALPDFLPWIRICCYRVRCSPYSFYQSFNEGSSSCCYRGSEYVASPNCWSHWWTERKHSRHLHYNFSHSSLSCHCHWKSRLCPRSTWTCSHWHMIEVEWDFNDWYMWFKFQFTNDAKFRLIAEECICGKTYTYRHTYRLTQLMYYMSMWGLLRSAPITQCWHAQSVVKQLLLSIC